MAYVPIVDKIMVRHLTRLLKKEKSMSNKTMELTQRSGSSPWEEDRGKGTFFDDTFDTGTPGSTKLIFFGTAAVASGYFSLVCFGCCFHSQRLRNKATKI